MSLTSVLKTGGTLQIGTRANESWLLTNGEEWFVGDFLGRVCQWDGEEEYLRLSRGEKTCLKSYLTYLRTNRRGSEDTLVFGPGKADLESSEKLNEIGINEVPDQAVQAYFTRTYENVINMAPMVLEVGRCVKLEVNNYGLEYSGLFEDGSETVGRSWNIDLRDDNIYTDGQPKEVHPVFKKALYRVAGALRLGNVASVVWYKLDGGLTLIGGEGGILKRSVVRSRDV